MSHTKLVHHYGANVNILDDNYTAHLLSELCSPEVFQPRINQLVQELYTNLITTVISEIFPSTEAKVPTRMTAMHPEELLETKKVTSSTKAVCVNLARAGTWPSHICYEKLHYVLPQQNLRQDHIFASRITNEDQHVTGSQLASTKIGGDVDQAIVIFPDPMGATGNTLVSAIDYYKKQVPGRAKQYVALHMIVTPEYLKKMTAAHPDVKIYALRVDRGMSPTKIKQTIPGLHWDLEKGLNDKDYIVPGGGGFGEIMNNSFV